MSQISPPIRILLVCAVAFMAAWMLFLRPSSEAGTPASETPAATTPVEAGGAKSESLPGKMVEKANEATAAQDAQAEQLAGGEGETGGTAPSGGTATAPAPATTATITKTGAPTAAELPSKEELATVPADVRRAFVKRQIVVLGVIAPKGADDKSVRKALKHVDTLHGRVFVKTVPVEAGLALLDDHARRRPLPDSLRRGRGLRLQGDDARRLGRRAHDRPGRRRRDPRVGHALPGRLPAGRRTGVPARLPRHAHARAHGGAEYSRSIAKYSSLVSQLGTDIAALSTPKKWRTFSRATRADLTHLAATTGQWHAALGTNPTLAKAVTAYGRYGAEVEQTGARLNQRFDAHDVLGCGSKS